MNLEYVFSYHASLKEPIPFGDGPYGTRIFAEVIEGEMDGPRLKGKILSGGGDWLLVGRDGWARLDVRAQMMTHDGVPLYVSYVGILEMNQKVESALMSGTGTDYGDHYFRTNPRFETGDPRYAWLTQSFFIGEGRVRAGRIVEYKVYRLT